MKHFALVAAVALLSTQTASAAAPQWGKIGTIGIGMLRAAVVEQQGFGVSDSCTGVGCATVGQYGKLQVQFSNGRVTDIDCAAPGSLAGTGCPAGFTLPDGVTLGTPVPYRTNWNGYTRYTPTEPQYDLFYWRRTVNESGRRIHVYLVVEKGHIISIAESDRA